MASFSGFGAHRALKAPMLSRRGGFAHVELKLVQWFFEAAGIPPHSAEASLAAGGKLQGLCRGGFAHAELQNYLRLGGSHAGHITAARCGGPVGGTWAWSFGTPVKSDGFGKSLLLSPERKGIGLYANGEAAGGRSAQAHPVPPGPGTLIAAGVWLRGERSSGGCGAERLPGCGRGAKDCRGMASVARLRPGRGCGARKRPGRGLRGERLPGYGRGARLRQRRGSPVGKPAGTRLRGEKLLTT